MNVMRLRRKDAISKLIHEKRLNTEMWRECKGQLSRLGVIEPYFPIWEEEKKYQRRHLKQKRNKKVEFLTTKYRRENEETNTSKTKYFLMIMNRNREYMGILSPTKKSKVY